jgi:hypothetical protein
MTDLNETLIESEHPHTIARWRSFGIKVQEESN